MTSAKAALKRASNRGPGVASPEVRGDNAAPKRPHDIDVMMDRIREAVKPYAKAALFDLRDQGFASVFQQLVACLISIRTRDEQSLPIAKALFARAKTPAEVAALSEEELEDL